MRNVPSIRPKILALSVGAVLVFAGCSGGGEEGASGGSTSESGASSGSTIPLVAIDNEFDPADLEVAAGKEVTVEFTNDGEAPHTFTSEELGVDTGTIEAGDSTTVTFMAPEDDTEFVCTLHAESDDMVGTIGVK